MDKLPILRTVFHFFAFVLSSTIAQVAENCKPLFYHFSAFFRFSWKVKKAFLLLLIFCIFSLDFTMLFHVFLQSGCVRFSIGDSRTIHAFHNFDVVRLKRAFKTVCPWKSEKFLKMSNFFKKRLTNFPKWIILKLTRNSFWKIRKEIPLLWTLC